MSRRYLFSKRPKSISKLEIGHPSLTMQPSNNTAHGVVPGYQATQRSTAPRSNTAGKHGAQQVLTGSSG